MSVADACGTHFRLTSFAVGLMDEQERTLVQGRMHTAHLILDERVGSGGTGRSSVGLASV